MYNKVDERILSELRQIFGPADVLVDGEMVEPYAHDETFGCVPFDDFQAAADTVLDIIAHRVVPATIEFMERDSILAVEAQVAVMRGIKAAFDPNGLLNPGKVFP